MSTSFSSDSIPNRFDYAEAAPRIYRQWEELGYFHAVPDASRDPFTIVIPPPNVTGALHLGHALNNTLQDVLIRWKRMQGFNVLWMPGTDHAGIATQAVVEKRLREEEKLTRHDLGREKLVQRIWTWKDEYEARILRQLKQMGCSCDWQRTRFTLDTTCARAVRQTFFNLFREGLIYRGKRLVNWDTFLQTAVSDDEVFHETVKGHFWHLRYPVIDPQPGEPTHVVVATTRPETMLGDTAVAVHPEPAAALDQAEAELRERLASAPAKDREGLEKQIEAIVARRQTMLDQLITLRNMARAGRMLMLPLANRPIPLVADEWAKPEMGSGCVKITPAHDPNDYEVGRRCKLPMINILNPDGKLNDQAGKFEGLTMPAARQKVVAELESLELLAEVEDREIDLAHSDRSKTPIEPYLADQWFVKMDELAQSAMDAVSDGRVQIFPSRYAKSYLDWLGEKRDWPVSRQLWWGHRIPVWHKTVDNEAQLAGLALSALMPLDATKAEQTPRDEYVDQIAARLVRDESSGAWTLFASAAPGCESLEQALAEHGFVQVDDVLDTWFSSALWPHSTLGWPEATPELEYFYPTSTLVTSRDIITLWVARMVLTGLHNVGEVPFKQVYIHPKILDREGDTMSKSKGNGVDPLDVIEKFGPDALRYGLAYLCTETQDVRMPVQFECPHCGALIDQSRANRELPRITCGKCKQDFGTQWARKDEDKALKRGLVVSERFEVSRNFGNKLWNAARFTLINLAGYESAAVSDDELQLEDRWLLSRLATVTIAVTEAFGEYRFADAARAVYDFAWDEFCSFYVEMAKGRLQDPAARPVAQRVLAYTLDSLLRLLHPMMPFITEEIWRLLQQAAPERGIDEPAPSPEHILVAPWPTGDVSRQAPVIEAQFATFQAVLGALREIRSRQNIAPRTTIRFQVRCPEATVELLESMKTYFGSMANAEPTSWGPSIAPPPTNAALSLSGMDVFVDLAGLIDVAAELVRNEKEEQKLLGLIKGKQAKLSNASFVERAPPQVVAAEREGLAKYEEQLATVRAALVELRKS
ncbi:MAG: class I tRNA ligase family protein [Pirellulales bacterium]